MKTRKYLFLMLAAAVFAACGSDDKNEPTGGNGGGNTDQPTVVSGVAQIDNSSAIGLSYADMIKKFPNPTTQFGDFYFYEYTTGKLNTLMTAINPETSTVYLVTEVLKEGAYTEEELTAYFAGKYKYYGTEKADRYDDDYNVIGQTNVYTYGNTEDPTKATLLIVVTGNEAVSFTNPQNVPVVPDNPALDDITPAEAAQAFLLKSVEDIEDEYPDVFMLMNGMYSTFMEENPYLMGIAFTPVDGTVNTLVLLYNEDLSDEDVIAYYTDLGYTATKTGFNEDDKKDIYTISNGVVTIVYCDARSEVTILDED